ncbi:MAG TPA: SMI1/KNR4 family protein [Nakamurella sp.]
MSRLISLVRDQTGLDRLPLRPGCSDSRVSRLESELGISLPDAYRELLRCFNGQEGQPELTFPPENVVFLSDSEVSRLCREFREYHDDDQFAMELRDADRVRSVLYHRGRVPIAFNESGGVYLCVDLIPGPAGTLGQLLVNINEIDCVVLERGTAELIERYARFLETGSVTVERQSPEYGDGYWWARDGRYLDYAGYREIAAGLDLRR